MNNPWLFLAVVIWVVCGTYSIVRNNDEGLGAALIASGLLGIGYVITHSH